MFGNNDDFGNMFSNFMGANGSGPDAKAAADKFVKDLKNRNKRVVNCPECKKKIKVTLNKKNKCPHCAYIFEVKVNG